MGKQEKRAAKQLRNKLGIRHARAVRLIRERRAMQGPPEEASEPGAWDFDTLLREAVEDACMKLLGGEVDIDLDADRPAGGPNFREVTIPRGMEGVSIESIEPDLDSIDWTPARGYEADTWVGTVQLYASVTLEGFMYKSDLYGEENVTVYKFDWNDHMSHVGFSTEVRLVFSVTAIENTEPFVELETVSDRYLPNDAHY